MGAIQTYLAEHADISGGVYIDQQRGGIITSRVVAPPGTDMIMLSPQYEAGVDSGACAAVGIAVGAEGRFVIDSLPPTTYLVTILEFAAVGAIEVGAAQVVVPPDEAVALDIHYERP